MNRFLFQIVAVLFYPFCGWAQIADAGEASGLTLGSYQSSVALVIDINHYDSDWATEPEVEVDSEGFFTLLEKNGFDVIPVTNPNSNMLRRALVHFLNLYGNRYSSRLFIFFSGHCHRLVPQFGADPMEYLVPIDAPHPKTDLFGFRESALSLFHLEHYIRRAVSQHALVILNGCRYGDSLSLEPTEAKDELSDHTMNFVREFLLFQKGRTSKSEPLKSRIIQALEGKADLNRDEIVTGAELVDFLKQGFGKKDSMLYGKLFQKGVHGDFLFSIQHPAVHFRANLMRPLNKGATPLEPKLTPFIKLTPKELEQNIYWPPNETEKTSVSIKEETFVEHRILGEE